MKYVKIFLLRMNVMCGLRKEWIWDGMTNCMIEKPI